MKPGDTAPARRRPDGDVESLELAGDCCLGSISEGDVVSRCVWFLLPIHEGETCYDRPTEGSGLHMVKEPPWTIRECPDGSIEIRASILSGKRDDRPEGYWHGYLDEGNTWRMV